MSRRTLTAVAAVLAAAGSFSLARAGERPDGPHGGPGFGPGFGPDPARLAERLGLSEDQQAQLKALREKDREASRPLFEAARQAHEAFREALEAANPDPAAVGRAALAMHAAEKNGAGLPGGRVRGHEGHPHARAAREAGAGTRRVRAPPRTRRAPPRRSSAQSLALG